MGAFSYLTGSVKQIMKSHVSDTNVRLSCIIPAKIHVPLPHPPFYNSNTLFKLSPVTWREITEWGFQKDLRPTDLKLRYSWKWNLDSQGLECFNWCACPSQSLNSGFTTFSFLSLPSSMYFGFSSKPLCCTHLLNALPQFLFRVM